MWTIVCGVQCVDYSVWITVCGVCIGTVCVWCSLRPSLRPSFRPTTRRRVGPCVGAFLLLLESSTDSAPGPCVGAPASRQTTCEGPVCRTRVPSMIGPRTQTSRTESMIGSLTVQQTRVRDLECIWHTLSMAHAVPSMAHANCPVYGTHISSRL